jgi:hypothetical protein
MGNSLATSTRVAHQAALRNADKVDGGFTPPSTPTTALGSPGDITHENAIYDQGVSHIITGLPGGTPVVFHGTIVPSNKQAHQITEAEFLDVLAAELARDLIGIGMGDGPDPEFVAICRGMLERFLSILIPPEARMERVLRAALDLPADLNSPLNVNTFVDLLLSKLDPLIRNSDFMLSLAERLEGMNHAKNGDDFERAAQMLFSMAGIMWFPPMGGDPKKIPFREYVTKVGNTVHTMLQAHYWLAHPNDVLMFEDFIVAGPNLLATIWSGGTWAAPYAFMPLLRAALMSAPRPGQDTGSTKRPDILNLTKGHLYEIKTVNQALQGVAQVAEYQRRLAIVDNLPPVRLAGMAPGDWRPFPLYYAGGTTIVAVEMYAPGVIVYQRIGSKVPVVNPLRFWSKEQQNYHQRQAQRAQTAIAVGQGALVAVALIGTLMLAVALAPAAAAAGGALLGGAATKTAVGLSVSSGLAFAL